MSEELLVNVTPQETRVAVVQNGGLQELHIERSRSRGIVANIYKGKVVRVLPGMQAAFVDVGLERTAFLHAADMVPHRTQSPDASEAVTDEPSPVPSRPDITDFEADLEFLHRSWHQIERKIASARAGELIHADLPLSLRVIRDLARDDVEKIRVDSRETYALMHQFAVDLMPQLADCIEVYPGERPIFDLYSIEDEIHRALNRTVDLKSGGSLVFDQTEAMTTVDVNTGRFVGKRNLEETLFKTNMEAAQAIARQLRLRNIGGIIIVDFIDMEDEDHRRQLMDAFERALARDRTRCHIADMSVLGLVEVTRKRTRESLERGMTETCPHCQGRGTQKTAQTLCYEIFREILREARAFEAKGYLVMASQTVIDMLLDEESTGLADLQEFIGKPIHLQVEPTQNQESYDVVLM